MARKSFIYLSVPISRFKANRIISEIIATLQHCLATEFFGKQPSLLHFFCSTDLNFLFNSVVKKAVLFTGPPKVSTIKLPLSFIRLNVLLNILPIYSLFSVFLLSILQRFTSNIIEKKYPSPSLKSAWELLGHKFSNYIQGSLVQYKICSKDKECIDMGMSKDREQFVIFKVAVLDRIHSCERFSIFDSLRKSLST